MKIHNKKALEFSFTWLFAIIVGAVILVLAVYAATKIISTGQSETGAAAAKEIGVLLNPLETSFQEGVTTSISLPVDTRIYNTCEAAGSNDFGTQKISTAQKSFGKFSEPSVEVSFPNKYIFSDEYEEGREFYVFSKPFDFPYKVADTIYITPSTEKYCFIDAPDNIEKEIKDLKQKNLLAENCSVSSEMISVCFNSVSGCDIRVRYSQGYVEKNTSRLYFETDALMYAAIFSSPKIYECQVQRLISRAEGLASIYDKKVNLLSQKECNSNTDTFSLVNGYRNYKDSSDLSLLYTSVKEIERENDISSCPLW